MARKNKRRNIHPKVDDTRSTEYHKIYMRKYIEKKTGKKVKPRRRKK